MNAVLAIREEFREAVPRALQDTQHTAKIIAFRTGATPRAVEAWRNGYHGPSVPHFFALAREIPELRALALKWLEAESTLDPETDRLRIQIERALHEHMERSKRP